MTLACMTHELDAVLARCATEQKAARKPLTGASGTRLAEAMLGQLILRNLCCRQLRQFMGIVQDVEDGRIAARQALLRHDGLCDVLGSSAIVARGLRAARTPTLQGLLSGSEALRPPAPQDHYGATLDGMLLALPAINAVLEATQGLARQLGAIANGHVLAVHAHGVPEARQVATEGRLPFTLTILDDDAATLADNRKALSDSAVTCAVAGAVGLIDGRTCFPRIGAGPAVDISATGFALIHAPDILTGLRAVQGDCTRGAAGLVGQLALRLAPGGRLLLGSPLAYGMDESDSFVIEVLLGCRHVTRTSMDVLSFADGLPPDLFEVRLLDGGLAGPLTPQSAFCWLEVTRLA